MLKNIFRHRRRSKNEPFSDENEPVTRTVPQSKTVLPGDTRHEGYGLSSQPEQDQQRSLQAFQLRSTENISSATDVRYKHFETEYINRAASSSQVTGHGGNGKYNSGHRRGRRQRLSSVVNKILLTHSESKPAPRTRQMVAPRGFLTTEQTSRHTGDQASDRHGEKDPDSVFTVPYSCRCCADTALHGDTRKNRPEGSWSCSQCRMQLTKGRDRHVSTESSPAALATAAIDSLRPDNSEPLYQSKDCPYEKHNTGGNPHCIREFSRGYCTNAICSSTYGKGQYYSAENVSDCDSTPCHRDISNVPSPLHIGDLECHESELLGDDDVVPELVEISPHPQCSNRSCTGDAGHDKRHYLPVVQPAVETGKSVNESEMYILTDSFLDDSFASFVHTAAAPESSQSTAVGRLLPEVMVADDYQVKYPSRMNYSNSYNLDSSTKAAQLPVVSPRSTADAEESFPQPSEKAETPEESTWCRKSLSEWSTDDVLRWVVSVGLVQFYDTFSSKLLHFYSTLLISFVCYLCH